MSFMVGIRRPDWNGLIGKAVARLGLAAVLVGSAVWGCVAYQHRQRNGCEACMTLKQQLADAQIQATNAVLRADNAERKLADAKIQATNAVSRADNAERKLADAQKQVADAVSRADNAERKLADAQKQVANAVSRADNAERKLAATRRESTSAFAYKVIDLEDGTVSHLDAVPSGGWTDEYKTRKLVLRRIEPGNFTMGSQPSEEGRDTDEQTQSVTLTKPYYMGVFEVTQGQWERVMVGNPSYHSGSTYPVESVTWFDCQDFCRKVKHELSLPTEAHWEYACRAGMQGAFAGALDALGWYDNNAGGETHAVGKKLPNAWGLHDMHGNVWEWCSDWYGSYGGDVTDPKGPASGVYRVNRGGSWFSLARYCRSAIRYGNTPGFRDYDLGFRLCCSAGPYE